MGGGRGEREPTETDVDGRMGGLEESERGLGDRRCGGGERRRRGAEETRGERMGRRVGRWGGAPGPPWRWRMGGRGGGIIKSCVYSTY